MITQFMAGRPPCMNRPHLRKSRPCCPTHLFSTPLSAPKALDSPIIPSLREDRWAENTSPLPLVIQYCFVSSRHRRRGAGRLLMEWGCKLADEMDLEAFVE